MHKYLSGLLAGVALLIAAPTALAADVNLRVEGTPDTLVPRSTVTTQPGSFSKDGNPAHSCSSSSAGGALERGTAGDWGARWGAFGYEIQTIKGERHASEAGDPSGTYWAFWINYRPAQEGACTLEVQTGDDVLFFPSCFGPGCVEPRPLRIASVPPSAQPGQAFDVRVVEIVAGATTTEEPASGATVTAGGRSFTAGADGVARVSVEGRGLAGVRASEPGHVRSATENVCVDCGATAPGATSAPGSPGAARDTTAPAATIAALRNGAVYSRRRAPRLLRGKVTADPSGLRSVKLKLTRRVGRRCSYFSGRRERFVPMRCGRGSFLRIGDRADWSYLLPKRLGRGRYVLEVKAIDGAFNRGKPARVRFRVK
jgi:hypothetical protein